MSASAPQDFSAIYTNANLAADATPYDSELLTSLVRRLEEVDGGSIREAAPAILGVILCGQRRGDAVSKLFHDLVRDKDEEQIRSLFYLFKHALSLTWAFIGLPHCIPACLGLVNELEEQNISVINEIDRPLLGETDWLGRGRETNRTIYRAVGNSEVSRMIAGYFPEISYIANAAVFGFLIGGSQNTHDLRLSELTVAGAIASIGATRQARSHFKGSIGLGNSPAAVQEVLNVVLDVAAWNGTKLPGYIDVPALAEEARANLEKLKEAS